MMSKLKYGELEAGKIIKIKNSQIFADITNVGEYELVEAEYEDGIKVLYFLDDNEDKRVVVMEKGGRKDYTNFGHDLEFELKKNKYKIYFRENKHFSVDSYEVEAKNIENAIYDFLTTLYENLGLYPENVDICNVEEVK